MGLIKNTLGIVMLMHIMAFVATLFGVIGENVRGSGIIIEVMWAITTLAIYFIAIVIMIRLASAAYYKLR